MSRSDKINIAYLAIQATKGATKSIAPMLDIAIESLKEALKYSPDQPRDEQGQWTDGGGGDGGSSGGGSVGTVMTRTPASGRPLPTGQRAKFDPKEGGVLFTGTAMPDDVEYLGGEFVYLTDDYNEAAAYAEGVHLGGSRGGTERVLAINMSPGKLVNVDDDILEALDSGDDIENVFRRARDSGADYAFYEHPSNVGRVTQHVYVALRPADQLGPAKRGWNIVAHAPWRRKS